MVSEGSKETLSPTPEEGLQKWRAIEGQLQALLQEEDEKVVALREEVSNWTESQGYTGGTYLFANDQQKIQLEALIGKDSLQVTLLNEPEGGLNSVAVVEHENFPPETRFGLDPARKKKLLGRLGIHHIRDDIVHEGGGPEVDYYSQEGYSSYFSSTPSEWRGVGHFEDRGFRSMRIDPIAKAKEVMETLSESRPLGKFDYSTGQLVKAEMTEQPQ
jgi:hypothetical protein